MTTFEIACAAIVSLYVVIRWKRCADAPQRAAFALRFVTLTLASFVGEDTVIRAYRFYAYAPAWHLFVDRVPLLIVCIWPVVVDSAWQLARALVGSGASPARIAIATGAIVLADASIIEPISVACDLWRWSEPGIFGVPPIGIFGWAAFTIAAVAIGEGCARSNVAPVARLAITIALAPIATHIALVVSWWAAFRFLAHALGAISAPIAVGVAWGILAPIAIVAWTRGLRHRVPLADLASRIPGAATFFVLLATTHHATPALVAYSIAFVPPYLALFTTRGDRSSARTQRSARSPRSASR